MNQEERRHWASWIGTIAEGVAGVMAVDGGIPASQGVPDPGPSRTRRPLTETEKRIIEHQGTEPPFSPIDAHGTEKRTGRKSREPDKSSGKILFSGRNAPLKHSFPRLRNVVS